MGAQEHFLEIANLSIELDRACEIFHRTKLRIQPSWRSGPCVECALLLDFDDFAVALTGGAVLERCPADTAPRTGADCAGSAGALLRFAPLAGFAGRAGPAALLSRFLS